MSHRQLPLPFAHRPEFAAADLVEAPSNAEALAWLARTADWPAGRLALWGEAGSGKTHLLHLWAARRGAAFRDGPGLVRAFDPPAAGIAIDDADAAPDPEALFHLLNRASALRAPVLLAARAPPARWAAGLPDLMSRLRAGAAVWIGPAEDSLLDALLARLLAERQLVVAAPVREFLLRRLPRAPGALREAVARLDRAALGAGRGVSRALAADILAEFETSA
ncbi:MAG: chromosomal replication initiator DnaA [Rhodospirillales bacterium]|nr:chromosomal replication initiator DnaA [Rhodospirillales bacterium]